MGRRFGRAGGLLGLVCWAAALGAPTFALEIADEQDWRGPFRVRSQFPFTLMFLAHTADEARVVSPGELMVDASFDWSNTFVGSQGLRRGRKGGLAPQPLSEEEFDDFVASTSGREAFFFDGEVLRTSLNVSYGLSERLQVGVEVPFLAHGNGYLDGLIQDFHDGVGVGNAGRESFPRDNFQYALAVDGQRVFRDEAESGIGIGDTTLQAKVGLLGGRGASSTLAIALASKLPTGSVESFRGSGHADHGVNVLLSSRMSRRGRMHVNAGYVWIGDWGLLPGLKTSNVYSALAAYEHLTTPRLSLVGQVQGSSSIFRWASGEDLAAPAYEATAGFKYGVRRDVDLTFSFTENFARYGSSPDIGFSVRIVYRPGSGGEVSRLR